MSQVNSISYHSAERFRLVEYPGQSSPEACRYRRSPLLVRPWQSSERPAQHLLLLWHSFQSTGCCSLIHTNFELVWLVPIVNEQRGIYFFYTLPRVYILLTLLKCHYTCRCMHLYFHREKTRGVSNSECVL